MPDNSLVYVPTMVGLNLSQAKTRLAAAKLELAAVNSVVDAAPAEQVLRCDPPEGNSVAIGAAVTLTVASEAPKAPIPAAADTGAPAPDPDPDPAGEQTAAVDAANGQPADAREDAQPTRQPAPAIDQPARSEDLVDVPPAPPMVTGLTVPAAAAKLHDAGLVVGSMERVSSLTVPPGGVIGASAPKDSKVTLTVSSGRHWFDWSGNMPTIIFGAIALAVLVILGRIFVDTTFLVLLAELGNARGLITFVIAISTVGIAIILVMSTVVNGDTNAADLRFDRGKQILTTLIGVLGTIVGFYFGQTTDSSKNNLSITTTELPAAIVGENYPGRLEWNGGSKPFSWLAEALPVGLTLNRATGEITGKPEKATPKRSYLFTLTDGATPPTVRSATITLSVTEKPPATPNPRPAGGDGSAP